MRDLRATLELLRISFLEIGGYTPITIEGNNNNVSTGAAQDVWGGGGNLNYLPQSGAERMNIVSDLAADSAAGTGTRSILIEGLDNDHKSILEVVAMDGINNVLTQKSYLRVRDLTAVTNGSSDANEGNIIATAETAGTIQCFMSVGIGVSKNSHFTVPAGKSLVVLGAELNATRTASGQVPNIEVNALFRSSIQDASWITAVERKIDTSVLDQLLVIQIIGNKIEEKTDARFTTSTDQNSSEVRVRLYGVLKDN